MRGPGPQALLTEPVTKARACCKALPCCRTAAATMPLLSRGGSLTVLKGNIQHRAGHGHGSQQRPRSRQRRRGIFSKFPTKINFEADGATIAARIHARAAMVAPSVAHPRPPLLLLLLLLVPPGARTVVPPRRPGRRPTTPRLVKSSPSAVGIHNLALRRPFADWNVPTDAAKQRAYLFARACLHDCRGPLARMTERPQRDADGARQSCAAHRRRFADQDTHQRLRATKLASQKPSSGSQALGPSPPKCTHVMRKGPATLHASYGGRLRNEIPPPGLEPGSLG